MVSLMLDNRQPTILAIAFGLCQPIVRITAFATFILDV